jgi:predicted NBD/HSP70 family sugar kinase
VVEELRVVAAEGFVGGYRAPSATTEDLGRSSAASVLSKVLTEGPLARSEIAARVGLTRATVTRVTNRLIELGLLVEGAPRRDNPGRPLVPLALAGTDRVAVSVHFGALESRVGLVDLQGNVLLELRDNYPDHEPAHLVEIVAGRVMDLVAAHGTARRILGVGASVGGWVHPETGDVVSFEPLGWENVPLADLIADATHLPVHFDQFARGLARAERMYGAARDLEDVLLVWIGSFVGAALVHDGDVRRGPHGAAGTIAHFPVRGAHTERCECGRLGCLVSAVNDQALLAEAVRRGLVPDEAGIRDLVQLGTMPWTGVPDLFAEVAATAGEAAAAMADLTNPSAVLVAGLVTTAPTYLESFRCALVGNALLGNALEVRRSGFGDLAPTVASAAVLLGHYFDDPLGYESAAPLR